MNETQRLARCWRRAMRAWARRWKVIRHDRKQTADALLCLMSAQLCRDQANQLNQIYETEILETRRKRDGNETDFAGA